MAIDKINDLVIYILVQNPEARNDDYILYRDYCKEVNPSALNMDFETVLLNRQQLGLASIETVGRARRKAVELNPKLAGDCYATARRRNEEEVYRDYYKR
jgi:hypothetical protein